MIAMRQLAPTPYGQMLTHAGVWSHDSQWIVYDVRSNADGSAFDGRRIERACLASGRVEVLYESQQGACCGVATLSPVDDQVVFILGPEDPTPAWSYGPSHRQAAVLRMSQPGAITNLDARNLDPPFTAGSLRGGSHLHLFSGDGRLVSFTYEDAILAAQRDGLESDAPLAANASEKNLRGVGVSVCGRAVAVPKTHPRNHDGTAFTVLVTRLVDAPRPGSDEISQASEEAWVGTAGSTPKGFQRTYALAFQGQVVAADGQTIREAFLVELPDNPTDLEAVTHGGPTSSQPGSGGQSPGIECIQGTLTRRPAPPPGVVQRRLTHTAHRRFPGIQGPRHWLRSSPDGSRIAMLLRDDAGRVQLFTISPAGGEVCQVSHDPWDVSSAFTWTPDGSRIAYAADGSIFTVAVKTGQSQRLTSRIADGTSPREEACVVSPNGRHIAFMRRHAHNQIFVVDIPRD